jgi:Skp family chaperone for outer membrane proteins
LSIKSIFLPALALIALSAQAQNLAVIDMQGAILKTADGQKAAQDLRAKYDPIQQALTKRGQDLTAKQNQYRQSADKMSDADKAKAEREIQALTKDIQRQADDAKTDAQNDQNKLLAPILQRLEAVMRKYAADKQITLIVDLSSQPNNLLYAAAGVNITSEVIALYNQAATAPATAPAAKPTGAATPQSAPKKTTPAAPPAKPQDE